MDPSDPQGSDDDATHQRKRKKRATCACERCRVKKLRCTGGQPCTGCRRAAVECSFGDLEIESDRQPSATTERLARLENVVTNLVTSINNLSESHRQVDGAGVTLPSQTFPPSTILPPSSLATTINSVDVFHPISTPDLPTSTVTTGDAMLRPPRAVGNRYPPTSSPQTYNIVPSPDNSRASVQSPEVSERVDSRWAALQHNPAPFPPLMTHPTAWSEQPASTSPQGHIANQSALGMMQYEATVKLHSEPVADGILDESSARTLFVLFCEKCHPLFPLLQPCQDLTKFFDQVRASSPFLFTTILAIASRYYPSHRDTQPLGPALPPITSEIFSDLTNLTYAHLGFVLFRKQHQLEDVQAVLLLAVWILRPKGQSPDQWMVTGLCTRLAYRIGIPNAADHPVIQRLANSTQISPDDVQEVNAILSQWHTWLMIKQYDMSLSLGFGRPHTIPSIDTTWQLYLTIIRKLGSLAQIDLAAATYVASLTELSTIATDLIAGLRIAKTPEAYYVDSPQAARSAASQSSILLSKLNPRLDDWQRRWTWSGSYNAIRIGKFTNIIKIYGEHTRLCLNSLSLNVITAGEGHSTQQSLQTAMSYLARACEATMSLVQCYENPTETGSVVRFGGEYLILILAQAAMFLVRTLVAPLDQPLPVDRLALEHYLKRSIEILEANNVSTTGICSYLARICRDLARHAGLTFDTELAADDVQDEIDVLDPHLSELDWDFDIGVLLGQNLPAGETGVDLGHYFDFTQS